MDRLEILKTYKLYIGGQFPRTESGRYYTIQDKSGKLLANVCLASRKDFRNSVVAARKAFSAWSERSAFNRGQILYRIAEMLEGRKEQFLAELGSQGIGLAKAKKELEQSIDRIVYYAGWCDKYQQIFSSINPVASSHFNFSILEPMGVVGIVAPEESSLLGLVSLVIPAIAGGNAVVVLASEKLPLCSITFAEVLATSDLPGGVVNVLTGSSNELLEQFTDHMDVNALVYSSTDNTQIQHIESAVNCNVKRTFNYAYDFTKDSSQHPYLIRDLQEVKTTWHPIEQIGGATSTY
jgi:acyl-CoA reductase-like NAD-dependent aldehyde dehydrogenase